MVLNLCNGIIIFTITIPTIEATAVVQVEDTKLIETGPNGKEEKVIEILTDPKENQDIRYTKNELFVDNS